ncbi:short-chain dehydrogenases/reductases (SDR) family protein [Pleurotus pulmonarius]
MSPQMSDSSSKGVAIITGAAEGIGRGIALRLVSDGFDVAINDIAPKQAALDQLVSEITSKTSRRAIAVPGDVSKDGDVKGIVDKVVRELGGLDVMIANAGIAVNKPIAETTVDEWDRLFAVNVRGTFLCYKLAANAMIRQGRGGRIVGACSIAGKKGIAEAACYSSTKFAVRGLTQSAAQEYGKFGITVNAYAPGHIETQFLGRFDGYQANKKGLKPGEWTETLKSTVAVGKNGTPTEIASLVSYLVSKDAHFITGQSIIVDGGGLFD